MTVPPDPVRFVDLGAAHAELASEIEPQLLEAMSTARFIGGAAVDAFESEFAEYLGAPHVVGCANGTDALMLALRALDIGPGDEVLVPAMTFVASAAAVSLVGARPVFVDVDPSTCLIDLDRLERAVTPRTKAVVVVHLYGKAVDMDAVRRFAASFGLSVIEDAAQAHGARWRGARVGTLGDVGCFSFYPGKNLGAYGDAGAVACRDERLAQSIRSLANHGRDSHTSHSRIGMNSRLDALQAIVLRAKLTRLDRWNEIRRSIARRYDEALRGTGCTPLDRTGGDDDVYHLYVVRVRGRDAVQSALRADGIETGVHYSTALHQLPAYDADLSLPAAEAIAATVLSLPMHPHLTDTEVERVVAGVRRCVRA